MSSVEITFKEESCKGCGLCIGVCPKELIFLDEERINIKGYNPAVIKSVEDCLGCGNCALMCPDLIINVIRA